MTDEELLQERFEHTDFAPLEGRSFKVKLSDDIDLSLKLDAVDLLRPRETSKPNIRKQPFALRFTGPADKRLENALYRLTAESGEEFILYLDTKDVDQELNDVEYESIVN